MFSCTKLLVANSGREQLDKSIKRNWIIAPKSIVRASTELLNFVMPFCLTM